MGKKSLFEPTLPPEEEGAIPSPVEKKTDNQKDIKTTAAKAEPEGTTVSPETAAAVETPAAAAATEPETIADNVEAPFVNEEPSQEQVTSGPEPSPVCYEETISSSASDLPPFEYDPLVDKKILMLGIIGVAGLIVILMIASMINAGNYYVRQTRGAVEIWQGDFSPLGQERILTLHGTHWKGPIRNSYSKKTVFSFAGVYYLEKVKTLAETPVSDDFDRIDYYLKQVRELFADPESRQIAARIDEIRKLISEAGVLQASGEKQAVSLAQKKIDTVNQRLDELIAEMSGDTGKAEKADSAH